MASSPSSLISSSATDIPESHWLYSKKERQEKSPFEYIAIVIPKKETHNPQKPILTLCAHHLNGEEPANFASLLKEMRYDDLGVWKGISLPCQACQKKRKRGDQNAENLYYYVSAMQRLAWWMEEATASAMNPLDATSIIKWATESYERGLNDEHRILGHLAIIEKEKQRQEAIYQARDEGVFLLED
ncbi:hypothetical protein NHQ30_001635 [Ciborinia camelliae]|nr:hypothetical protein NHQ30_001635 [Ciborinia camelliae]